MIMPRKLIIVGAGGAGAEALWVARRANAAATAPAWDLVGLPDDAPGLEGTTIEGARVIGKCARVAAEFAG